MNPQTPWPICQVCNHVPFSLFHRPASSQSSDPRLTHFLHPSFKTFSESATKGCHACTILHEAVREPFKSRLETAPVYLESMLDHNQRCSIVLSVDLHRILWSEGDEAGLRDIDRQSEAMPFLYTPIAEVKFAFRIQDIPLAARNYKGMISQYQDDPGAVTYIRQSLDHCLANHKYSCEMVQFPHSAATTQSGGSTDIVFGKNGLTVAPTRLVDVGSEGPAEPPRVVPGKHCLRDGHNYLALSYCNGATPHRPSWQYTSTTMKQFEDEIPLDALPQTLHDAILWTRKMGERFIWIDCLCIIQDSAEDWAREASRMASIYGSALLTLVAASGSVYGGITDRRNPLKNSAVALRLRDNHDSGDNEIVFLLPHGQKRDTPPSAPTDTRGWCYQEDILSPRIIKFGLKQVEWDCRGNKVDPPRRAQALERLRPYPTFRWYTLWYRFIEWYSHKHLTYATDKLPAFSGIAANKSPGIYLAGLLQDDIWAGLLWCRDDTQQRDEPGHRYSSYIAPSWSWASCDAPIRFHEAHNRHWRKPQLESTVHDPELHEASTEPSTLNPLGAVKAGSIEMTAHCVIAVTTLNKPNLFCVGRTNNVLGRQRLRSISGSLIIGELVYDVAGEAKENTFVQCVLLHVSSVHEWTKNGVAGLGIALMPSSGASRKTIYRRVGYVQYVTPFLKVSHRKRLTVV